MKKVGLLVFLFLSANIFAQSEFGGKKILPSLKPKTEAPKPLSVKPDSPSIFDTPKTNTDPLEMPSKSFSITPSNEFVDANKPYLEKMNKKMGNEEQRAIRKDVHMGDLKTKSESVFVHYRDAAAVDGDMIKIYANKSIIRSSVTLGGQFNGFLLKLDKGFNTIEFEALNQGSSGPNTAEMEIFDDQGISIFRGGWDLATGFKASVIVVKE